MGQLLIVYDANPYGRVIAYETAYSEDDAFDAWLQCLHEHGENHKPRIIDSPGMPVLPGTPGRLPKSRPAT